MANKEPKTMRGSFIRITAENNTQDGLVSYTIDDVKKMVLSFCERYANTKYAYVCHDKDFNADGPAKMHFHIYLKYKSPVPFKYIKEAFPFGNIEKPRSERACVQYLVHKNNAEKAQYDKNAIFTNYEQDAFDALFVNDQKVEKLSEKDELHAIINDIAAGNIRRFNATQCIEPIIFAKYKSQIFNAFEYADIASELDPNRNIDVWFMTGGSGDGKTTIAKAYAFYLCEQYGFNGVTVSSSSNDPFQNYKGQDVLILDDMRDNAFTFQDLIKVLDHHTKSSSKSRFFNKTFTGKLLIITSWQDLDQWYKGVTENKKQLYRRISKYFKIDSEYIASYDIEPFSNSFDKHIVDISKNIIFEQFNIMNKKAIDNNSNIPRLTKLERFKAFVSFLAKQGIELSKEEEDDYYYEFLDADDIALINGTAYDEYIAIDGKDETALPF